MGNGRSELTEAGLSDAELLAQTAAGRTAAFAELVDRHKDGLVRYLSRLTNRSDRAEDLAQEAFLRLFRAAGSYREEGRFEPYLYRIATNLLRTDLRRETRRRLLALRFLAPSNGHSPAPPQTELLAQEEQRVVARELARLPPRLRIPVVLFELEGWPYQEIARLLRIRPGTVKSRIHRGRERLRARLAPFHNGDRR